MATKREMRHAIELAEAADDSEEAEDRPYVRPPAPGAAAAQVYSVRIPVAALDALRRLAAERGLQPSTLMREWVLERLERETAPSLAAVTRVEVHGRGLVTTLDAVDDFIAEGLRLGTWGR